MAELAVLLHREFTRETPESAARRSEFELIYAKGMPGAKVLVWRYGGATKLVVYLRRASEPAVGDAARPPTQK